MCKPSGDTEKVIDYRVKVQWKLLGGITILFYFLSRCTWQRNLACVMTVSLLITCLLVSVIIYLLPHCHCVSGKVI